MPLWVTDDWGNVSHQSSSVHSAKPVRESPSERARPREPDMGSNRTSPGPNRIPSTRVKTGLLRNKKALIEKAPALHTSNEGRGRG